MEMSREGDSDYSSGHEFREDWPRTIEDLGCASDTPCLNESEVICTFASDTEWPLFFEFMDAWKRDHHVVVETPEEVIHLVFPCKGAVDLKSPDFLSTEQLDIRSDSIVLCAATIKYVESATTDDFGNRCYQVLMKASSYKFTDAMQMRAKQLKMMRGAIAADVMQGVRESMSAAMRPKPKESSRQTTGSGGESKNSLPRIDFRSPTKVDVTLEPMPVMRSEDIILEEPKKLGGWCLWCSV